MSRPAHDGTVARLRENAAMMVAGIDADRRSIALAQAAGDSIALREAEASLRRHLARLTADVSALAVAGDRTAHSTLTTNAQTTAPPLTPTRVAVRP